MEQLVGLQIVERLPDDMLIVEQQWAISGSDLERFRTVQGVELTKPVPALRTETRRGRMTADEFNALWKTLTTTS